MKNFLFGIIFVFIGGKSVLASHDLFDEGDPSNNLPSVEYVVNACSISTKQGLKKHQKKAIEGAYSQYLLTQDKEVYFKTIDQLVGKTILGRHAEKMKALCLSEQVDFMPVRRSQPGHNRMKIVYSSISAQNKVICTKGGYVTKTGVKVNSLDIPFAIKNSKKVKSSAAIALQLNQQFQTVFQIVDQDTLAGALDLHKLCKKVVLLNFANSVSPGGGYLSGCNAQEEDICRRTTLYPVLNCMKKTHKFYPIKHDELIFSEGVMVIRGGYKEQFSLLENPTSVCVLTQAAYNLNSKMRSNDCALSGNKFSAGTREKILLQLRLAKLQGCDGIVLGAFGCGAFKNDPKIIAQIYLTLLSAPEFKGQFKFIRFSIPNGGKNLAVFSEILSPLMK